MLSIARVARLACIGFFTLLSTTAALAAETPTSLDGATVVGAEQVKDMIGKGTLVIDARVAAEYAEAHVKGAISIPYKEKSAKDVKFDAGQDSFEVDKLPKDKNAGVIFYCNAAECWKSYKASVAAIKSGHKKVYWFRGGLPEWKAKGLPTE